MRMKRTVLMPCVEVVAHGVEQLAATRRCRRSRSSTTTAAIGWVSSTIVARARWWSPTSATS